MQPRHAAFPEIVESTGGGLIAEPTAAALAAAIEELLFNPARARALGEAGQRAVLQRFSVQRMAEDVLNVYREAALSGFQASNPDPGRTSYANP